LRRLIWHPLLVVLLFAELAYRTYLGRTGILGLASLGFIGFWLGLSVYDWLTAHRLLDYLYSEEGESGGPTSKSAREYLRRAGQCTLERDFDGAIALLDEAIRRDPQFADAYCDRGWNYLETGMHDEALADFNKAIELKPTYTLAYNNRGVLCSKLQDWDGSIADFSKTLELDPDHPWARDNLTNSYKRAQARRALGNVQPTTGAEAPCCVSHPRAPVDSRMRPEALQTGTEDDAKEPSAQRVTARAMVLSAIVCRALLEQEHADGIHEHSDGRTALLSWIEALGLRSELESAEFDFLATPIGRASRRQMIDGEWRKEGLSVLAWALGRFQLPPYDQPTDPDAVLQSLEFLSVNDAQALRESATLRPSEEIRRFASHITIVHWRIRTFQIDPQLVAPSVDFDVRGDGPVPTDKGVVLRKIAAPGIGERMDFAAYLRQHPRFEDYWLDHLRLIDGDLVIGGRVIGDAFPPKVEQCRSVAVERQIAAYWLAGDDVTYSKVVASTLLSGC